jgi:uncharacterized protein (DUF924 family)
VGELRDFIVAGRAEIPAAQDHRPDPPRRQGLEQGRWMRCAVLDYWFGSDADDSAVAREARAACGGTASAIDDDLRSKFGAKVELAGRNELIGWQGTPAGLLALIL